MPDSHEYSPLPPPGTVPPIKRRSRRPIVLYSLAGLAAVAVLVTLVLHVFPAQTGAAQQQGAPAYTLPHSKWTNCGSSPAEARARGCRFDILSTAWQVPDCYDEELLNDWMAVDKWRFFADEDGKIPLSTEEAMSGDHVIYFEERYHEHHCMFMYRLMHRAFTVRKFIDSHIDNYNHTLHCYHAMTEGRIADQNALSTVGELRYPTCRPVP